jgi:hypothetical protein
MVLVLSGIADTDELVFLLFSNASVIWSMSLTKILHQYLKKQQNAVHPGAQGGSFGQEASASNRVALSL